MREPALSEDRPLRFALSSVDTLMRLGCNFQQAVAVTCVAIIASCWGLSARAHNYTGIILTREAAQPGVQWFRSGDTYFRAFSSAEDFYKYWLSAYLPKEAGHPYSHVGAAFWENRPWFEQYGASNFRATQTDPDPDMRGPNVFSPSSITEWRTSPPVGWLREQAFMSLWSVVTIAWAQDRLGTDPTGNWTRTSDVALHRWAARMGLPRGLEWSFQIICLLTGKDEPEPKFFPANIAPKPFDEPSVDETAVLKASPYKSALKAALDEREVVSRTPAAPVVEPAADLPAESVESVVEPAADPPAEPVAEPSDPVVEPVAEPVAEPEPEPVVEPPPSSTTTSGSSKKRR